MLKATGYGKRILGTGNAELNALIELARGLTASNEQAVESSFNFTLLALLIGTAVAMLFAGAAWFVLSRAIAAPINGMSAFMGRLADGHYDDMTANQERGDEIGMMAQSVAFLRQPPIENSEIHARAELENDANAKRAKHHTAKP